jgi:hypothetical protein
MIISLLLASLLLAATTAAPLVGPENLSPAMGPAPAPYDIAGPSSAAVRDGDGFVIAFAAQSPSSPRTRIFVARLDATGRTIESHPREMPVTSESVDAGLPSIAIAADGHYVGQMEMGSMRIGVVWLTNPTLPPPATPFARLAGSPAFVRGGDGKLFAVSDSQIFEYTLDGRLVGITPKTMRGGDDAMIIGGKVVLAGHLSQPSYVCAMPPPGLCGPPGGYNLLVGVEESPGGKWNNFDFLSTNGVGAASDGATILAAFYNGEQRLGGDVQFARFDATTFALRDDPRRLGSFEADPLRQALRPAVAYDGNRYLVVWQTATSGGTHAVRAAAVDADSAVTEIAFPHLGDETLPNVVAADRGRFLISYESRRNGQWHLATRMIYFDFGRRPVAGR